MKNQLNPKWLILTTILPTLLLAFILQNAFFLIDSELDEESLQVWRNFTLILGTISLINFGFIAYFNIFKAKIHLIYPIIFIPVYLFFALYYQENMENLMPWSLPRWMLTENIEFYVLSLLTPTVLILLYILALGLTNFEKVKYPYINLVFAAFVPLSLWLATRLINALEIDINDEIYFFIFCLSFIFFLFFLIRLIILMVNKENAFLKKYSLVFRIIVGIIFPILGLLVNQGFFLNFHLDDKKGIFGDFSNYWFFIIAILNGILFCFGEIQNGWKKTLVYFLRCVFFVYIAYFFIVFLPFLPISVLFILFAGLGFLTLTPLFLFFLQGKLLLDDFGQLKQTMPKFRLWTISIIGFLAIPTILIVSYKIDAYKLDKLLDYVFAPDYSNNKASISRRFAVNQINNVKKFKNEAGSEGFFTYTPYLSNIYKSIVYDNLMLSDSKIGFMEDIFKGETNYDINNKKRALGIDKDVLVDNIQVKTVFDNKENAYVSEISIDLRNITLSQTEFATDIKIPDGAFVIDYFLKVEDTIKHGILAEKRTAIWVYNQIVNERKDPGIIFYRDKNTLELRIFPFSKNQERSSGFTILHRDPVQLIFGGKPINLDCPNRNLSTPEKIENSLYFPMQLVANLPIMERQAFYHFLVDFSKKEFEKPEKYVQLIKKAIEINHITNNYDVSILNWKMQTLNKNNWEKELLEIPYEGGLNLDLGLEKTLFNHLKDQSYCPKIILVSNKKMNKSVKRYTEFDFLMPDENLYYNLTYLEGLSASNFNSDSSFAIADFKIPMQQCKAYKEKNSDNSIYIPVKNENYLVPAKLEYSIDEKRKDKWENGVLIANNSIYERFYPNNTENWLAFLKMSFQNKILSSNTTFMVVETKMQEEFLAIKQKEVLDGNKNLDLGEEIEGMDEPPIWIYGVLFVLVLFVKRNQLRIS